MRLRLRTPVMGMLLLCLATLIGLKPLIVTAATHQTHVSMSLDQYLNVSEAGMASDQIVQASVNYQTPFWFQTFILSDVDAVWSGNEETLFYNIKNLNLNYGHYQKVTVGVLKKSWNKGLEYWGSSEWNPQMQRNRLQIQEGGMPGVYYRHRDRGWLLTLMYSPYFLPHTGPDYKFTGGNVVSHNPWFLSPPSSVPYEGEDFSTNYRLNDPSLSSFLNVPTYLASLEMTPSDKFTLQLSWANKANPHILTDLDFVADASQPDVPINVLVQPRIVRHQLLSAEASWQIRPKDKLRFSYLNESFDSPSFSTTNFTYQVPSDQNVFGVLLERERYRYNLAAGVLFRDGGDIGSIGELSSALVNQGVRHIYQRAIKTSVQLKKLWRWDARGSVAYDWEQKGFVVSAQFTRKINNKAQLQLGFDAIEPLNEAPESSFIYQYRNLDRIWAGVGYVF